MHAVDRSSLFVPTRDFFELKICFLRQCDSILPLNFRISDCPMHSAGKFNSSFVANLDSSLLAVRFA
jgi:hypothetical protein